MEQRVPLPQPAVLWSWCCSVDLQPAAPQKGRPRGEVGAVLTRLGRLLRRSQQGVQGPALPHSCGVTLPHFRTHAQQQQQQHRCSSMCGGGGGATCTAGCLRREYPAPPGGNGSAWCVGCTTMAGTTPLAAVVSVTPQRRPGQPCFSLLRVSAPTTLLPRMQPMLVEWRCSGGDLQTSSASCSALKGQSNTRLLVRAPPCARCVTVTRLSPPL